MKAQNEMAGRMNFGFSNGWKNGGRIFQPLEVLGAVFPIVGSFGRGFSNRWKIVFLAAALPCLAAAGGDPIPFEDDDTLAEIQEKIELNGYSFTVNTNWVFNMPAAERKAFHRRFMSEASAYRLGASDDPGPLADVMKQNRALPASFDWRNYGGHSYIGAVRNQGSCGSCYSFGANAAAECTYNYAMGLTDGSCVDFSESFIIWCLGSLPDYYEHFYGCDGADYDYAELTAMTREGVSYEAAYPYTTTSGCNTNRWNDPRVVFDSWHRIACGDITAIKTAIMTYGAVDAAVYAGSAFDAYSSGIYKDSRTSCNGSPCYYTTANHAIALVGWNDTGNYWILRNSWGSSWGESGYMRIDYSSAVVSCESCYLYIDVGPTVTTDPATGTNDTAIQLNGTINPNGHFTQYYFEYGSTTEYGSQTATQSAGSGSSALSVSTNITGLDPRTLYHFRLVGVSGGRTIPGSDRSFTTTGPDVPPDCTTLAASGVAHVYATVNGTVNPRGLSTTYWFEYGLTAAYGSTSATASAGSGSTDVSVSRTLAGLTPETTYHYRLAALNLSGVDMGEDMTFTTTETPVTYLEEGFEHAGAAPADWTIEYVRPCVDWQYRNGGLEYPTAAHSGSYNAYAYYAGWNGRSTRLITPPINFGTNRCALLTFWLVNKNWAGDQDVLRILSRTSSAADWTIAAVFDDNVSAWTQQSVYLTNLSTTFYVAFESLLHYGYGVAVDDISVRISEPTPTPTPVPPCSRGTDNDFDGDRCSDIGCYYPRDGSWFIYMSSSGFVQRALGFTGTEPITDDFDGDGLCDYGTYYAPYGWWDVMCSSDGLVQNSFGFTGTTPVTGDFDGDGTCDFGCYYPPTGTWYLYKSSSGFWTTRFGFYGTIPIAGDFDGDLVDDFGCYYPPAGAWYIYKSRDGFWTTGFGFYGTEPVTGDFDGDGVCDFGCYYPFTGAWYLYKSRDGFWTTRFGFGGTEPVTGDFDGDGVCDFGCYYPFTGAWYLYKSRDGFWTTNFGFGGTIPLH